MIYSCAFDGNHGYSNPRSAPWVNIEDFGAVPDPTVTNCHFDGGFTLDGNQILPPPGCEFYLAPGSRVSGLRISPVGHRMEDCYVVSHDKPTLTVGDIVALVTGGPDMAVTDVCGDTVYVAWFAGDALNEAAFPPEALHGVD